MKKLIGILLAFVLAVVPMTAYAQSGFYPEDVFGSQENCAQYFERCDQNTFEEIDGETVMTVAYHPGIDWMYSKAAVDYNAYTVSFDFALTADNGSEANLLFAMTADGNAFHQISFVNSGGNLYLVHYEFTGSEWITYADDHMMFASYEGETWCHAVVELMPDEINIYVDDEYALTLMETPDYANGHIGLRCGSAGGFKVKNFALTEGVAGDVPEEPTEVPTEEPTEVPSEESTVEVTEEPTAEESIEVSTQTPILEETQSDSSNMVLWLVLAGVALVAVIIATVFCLKKVKK